MSNWRKAIMPHSFLGIIKLIGGSYKADESGQTLVEYALIIAFIVIALIGALTFLGVNLGDYYETIANTIPSGYP